MSPDAILVVVVVIAAAVIAVHVALARPRCPHTRRRCVHGDEILHLGARAACRDCGRGLPKAPLPEPCSVTGQRHYSAAGE